MEIMGGGGGVEGWLWDRKPWGRVIRGKGRGRLLLMECNAQCAPPCKPMQFVQSYKTIQHPLSEAKVNIAAWLEVGEGLPNRSNRAKVRKVAKSQEGG